MKHTCAVRVGSVDDLCMCKNCVCMCGTSAVTNQRVLVLVTPGLSMTAFSQHEESGVCDDIQHSHQESERGLSVLGTTMTTSKQDRQTYPEFLGSNFLLPDPLLLSFLLSFLDVCLLLHAQKGRGVLLLLLLCCLVHLQCKSSLFMMPSSFILLCVINYLSMCITKQNDVGIAGSSFHAEALGVL